MAPRMDLDYELPPAIRALQASWQGTFQSAATVSALLAAIEAQLFVLVKAPNPDSLVLKGRLGPPLLLLTYFTFFISITATISSLVLNVHFGRLEKKASTRRGRVYRGSGEFVGPTITVLKHCGMHPLLEYHILIWALLCVLCCVSLFTQVLIYIWAVESRLVAVMISVSVCIMVILVLVPFIPIPEGSGPTDVFENQAEAVGHEEETDRRRRYEDMIRRQVVADLFSVIDAENSSRPSTPRDGSWRDRRERSSSLASRSADRWEWECYPNDRKPIQLSSSSERLWPGFSP